MDIHFFFGFICGSVVTVLLFFLLDAYQDYYICKTKYYYDRKEERKWLEAMDPMERIAHLQELYGKAWNVYYDELIRETNED